MRSAGTATSVPVTGTRTRQDLSTRANAAADCWAINRYTRGNTVPECQPMVEHTAYVLTPAARTLILEA